MALEGGPTAGKRFRMVDLRNILSAMWPGSGSLLENDFTVTPAPSEAGHAVVISDGRAVAQGAGYRQGAYFAWSDDDETKIWPGPDAQPRIDTLILEWADPSMGAVSGDPGPRWTIVPGQPAASPVARSDSVITSTYAQPGAWLRVADVRINAGQTTIAPGNITRRLQALSSRSKSTSLKVSTETNTAFRNWIANNPNTRKAFPGNYWDPVEVVVPYTGEVEVYMTGRMWNASSPNAGLSLCYALSGANTTGISEMGAWEVHLRSQIVQTASTIHTIRGLTPGLTLFTPSIWASSTTVASQLGLTHAEITAKPVF